MKAISRALAITLGAGIWVTMFVPNASADRGDLFNFGAGVNSSRPAVTLRVVNEAGVDQRTLIRAGDEAAAILRRSEVELVWLSCEAGWADPTSTDPCRRQTGPVEFWFFIVRRKPRAKSDEMVGFTDWDEISNKGLAGAYYPAAVELARRYRIDCDAYQILGAAIAHEVGHLLLGANAHSSLGLMQAFWGPAQVKRISTGSLNFTSDQSKQIQNAIRIRNADSQ
jgi:hypothetical protein